jgi:Susd and RagB outer membrane lipoprotein
MKNIKNIAISFGMTAGILMSSCTDNFEEINIDKAKISQDGLSSFAVDMLFANGQYRNYNQSYQVYQNLHADLYAQYFANVNTGFVTDRYGINDSYVTNGLNQFYQQTARPLEVAVVETSPTGQFPNPVKHAIAKIMKVAAFATRTDYWGPIPYSKFNNGELAVPYDTQEFMYKDFLKVLKESANYLKGQPVKSAFGTNDQIFNGNVDKWVKFANSLRLRLAMRISNVEPALAKTEAEDAVASGVMTIAGGINAGAAFPANVNGDEAFFRVTANSPNVLNSLATNSNRMSSAMESYLKGYTDPRMDRYFAPVSGTNFKGLRNGYPVAQLQGDNSAAANSNVGPLLQVATGTTTPNIVMTLAEVNFLRAEGALKGWNMGTGTAKSFYEDGIRSSLRQWGITAAAAVDAYLNGTKGSIAVKDGPALSQVPVKWSDKATDNLEQVITQKWLALYPNGLEAWAEYRRTGFPRLYSRIASESPILKADDIVRRVVFGSYEITNNNAEYKKALDIELGGKDQQDTRLWWNK